MDFAARDSRVTRAFERAGLTVRTHHSGTLLPPGSVLTNSGEPYTVYTPFKRRWLARLQEADRKPLPAPKAQQRPDIHSDELPEQTDGVPRLRVAERWPGGSAEAARRLDAFVASRIEGYATDRDFPALDATSTLSPPFHGHPLRTSMPALRRRCQRPPS